MYWASSRRTEKLFAPAARVLGLNAIRFDGMLAVPPTRVNGTTIENARSESLSTLSLSTRTWSEGSNPHDPSSQDDVPQQPWETAVWKCVAEPRATMSKSLTIDRHQSSQPYVPASIWAAVSCATTRACETAAFVVSVNCWMASRELVMGCHRSGSGRRRVGAAAVRQALARISTAR